MMRSDAGQSGGEGANFQRVVIGEGDVVLAMSRAGQANVAAGLASRGIAQRARCLTSSAPDKSRGIFMR